MICLTRPPAHGLKSQADWRGSFEETGGELTDPDCAAALTEPIAVAAGNRHTLMLYASGTILSCGAGERAQ